MTFISKQHLRVQAEEHRHRLQQHHRLAALSCTPSNVPHLPQARREAEKQASKETRRQEELRSYKQVMQVGVVVGLWPTC